MLIETVGAISLLVLAFALVSKKLGESVLTPPMFFVGCGLLLGGHALGVLELTIGESTIEVLAEATLIFVLFVDAANTKLPGSRKELGLPIRLLGIGLPLQILLGALVARVLLPELTWWQCGLLSAVLAPTDAALGQAVVTSERVPERLRRTLSVESGLNDGIALPVVTIFLATCLGLEQEQPASTWALRVATQITFGVGAGVLVGWLGAKTMQWSGARSWISTAFARIAVLSVALLCYVGAHAVGGNGFIAAFVGGLVFGACSKGAHSEHLFDFAEEEGQLLTLLTFFFFGSAFLGETLGHIGVGAVVYALLSLTIVRLLPVVIATLGSGESPATVAFVGWFGPRGLASILFALLVVHASELEQRDLIVNVAFLTVLFSVVLHGITAQPGARWIERQSRNRG